MNTTAHEQHEALAAEVREILLSIRTDRIDGGDFILLHHDDGLVTKNGVIWLRINADKRTLVGWIGNEHDCDMRHLIEMAV